MDSSPRHLSNEKKIRLRSYAFTRFQPILASTNLNGLTPLSVLNQVLKAIARNQLKDSSATNLANLMATTSYTKKAHGLETMEPAVTPPPANADTAFIKKPKLGSAKTKKKEIPEGLWTKCPKCSTMIYDKELDDNLKVCHQCNFHFQIGARERIHTLVET